VAVIGAVAAFALVGTWAVTFDRAVEPAPILVEPPIAIVEPAMVPTDAASWFGMVRQYCNPVEVDTRLRFEPAPATPEGSMYEAACFALAGKIDRAREIVMSLEAGLRPQAVGVVFEAGHPAADAGDDIAAGPLMELVVEFWPNHYMALYHAGAARYETGDYAVARKYLEAFMVEYGTEDGWRGSARGMLEDIAERGFGSAANVDEKPVRVDEPSPVEKVERGEPVRDI
jgi:hypothetical protein